MKSRYPLTSSQYDIWIEQNINVQSSVFNIGGYADIHGKFSYNAMNHSVNQLIRNNDALRITFIEEDGVPWQCISSFTEYELPFTDFSAYKDPFAEARAWMDMDFKQVLDFQAKYLFKFHLLKIADNHYIFYNKYHHIITDGWGIYLGGRQIIAQYNSFLSNENTVQETQYSYVTYIEDNLKYKDSELYRKSAEYWKKKFNQRPESLFVSDLLLKPDNSTLASDRKSLTLKYAEYIQLKDFCDSINVTIFNLFLGLLYILLYKISGLKEMIIGIALHNRGKRSHKKTLGLFAEITPLLMTLNPDTQVVEFIQALKKELAENYRHQRFPAGQIEKIAGANALDRLFDIVFSYEMHPYQQHFLDCKTEIVSMTHHQQNNALTIHIREYYEGDNVIINFDFRPDVFKNYPIDNFISAFKLLCSTVISKGSVPISELDIISTAEKILVLDTFNNTERFYPESTIHEMFEAQVLKTPDQIAIRCEERNMTYRQLNEKANSMAKILLNKGVEKETPVGVFMDKSPETMICLLAILKAGGAYVPLDPDYPRERILHMLNDAGVSIVLTDTTASSRIPFTSLQNIEANEAQITVMPLRSPILGFDILPMPDRSLIDMQKYKNKIGMASITNCISLQTTRGCPYKCVFCHKVWSKKHVYRSAANIFNEIEYYYKRGVTNFSILDDCFNLNAKNGMQLFKLIVDNKIRIKIFFPNGLRGDILTKDYIDAMVEAGVININLSLETASPRLQKLVKKYLNLEKFRDVIDYIATQHPEVILELATMHGFPTETEAEALETLKFILDTKWIHFPYIHILKVYPNTEMEELALDNGILKEDIMRSANLAYHEIPDTMPFPKSFTRKYQATFLNEYFLNRERLQHVLPVQMKQLSEDAIIEKYSTYLPVDIKSINDILEFANVPDLQLPDSCATFKLSDDSIFDRPFKPQAPTSQTEGKILFIDLSQHFSSESMLYKVVEQPLGLLYLLTYLNNYFGNRITGKIYKSGIDFDSYEELKTLVEEYNPGLIGIRSLSLYRDFFHCTVSLLRQWGVKCPIITGGPYATSDYNFLLKDKNVDIAVIGEGEEIITELIEKMLECDFTLPDPAVLKTINGIAFREHQISEKKSRTVLFVDNQSDLVSEEYAETILPAVNPHNLAYILYTSGSTGKPKGVMVEHSQVNNCLHWMQEVFELKQGDIVVQRTNLTFDPSVWEIFWPLAVGATVRVLTIQQGRDVELLINLMSGKEKIKIMYCPASLVGGITYLLNSRTEKTKLKIDWFLTGAEPIRNEVVKDLFKYLEGRFINTYGPSECTINNTYFELQRNDERAVIPIGKPIANNRIYILSRWLQPLAIGIPGEIYIAGKSLARGYIGNPEKTEMSFLENPFKRGQDDNILYKTGDLGRWQADGNIEIMGRTDNQVKIRGYRIEPGEIETSLLRHPSIHECIVVVKDTQDSLKTVTVCKKCGITSAYPDIRISETGVCELCENLTQYRSLSAPYFKRPEDLYQLIEDNAKPEKTQYDCLVLYAGGKASAYALYRLAEQGYNVLTVTFDNGYFSKAEIEHIKTITGKLGFDNIVLTHPRMDEILALSMKNASTLCKGCFFVSAALAQAYAHHKGIGIVINTTFSRGQIMENKLLPLFRQGITEPDAIEKELEKIQTLNYVMNEEIFELIDQESIKSGAADKTVKMLDFFRYYELTNKQIVDYLNDKDSYWETRKNQAIYSTNCPIKQIADYAHIKEKHYHFYGAATSWEKRFGNISLETLEKDLHCQGSQQGLDNFLRKIHYKTSQVQGNIETKYLCAYIVSDEELPITDLREYLSREVPEYMIPPYFIRLEELPISAEGKIDRKRLPEPEGKIVVGVAYEAAQNETEEKLVEIWKELLSVENPGINDNFFELGGHSLKATLLAAKINRELQTDISLSVIFRNPTIKKISDHIISRQNSDTVLQSENPILIRSGNDKRNLFFIHDGSGSIEAYLKLTQSLNPDYTCWGIVSDRFDENPGDLTIETVATDYINKIRQIQNDGTYYLAGWSVGGTIAYEITRQLEQTGDKVDFLALFDTMPPQTTWNDFLHTISDEDLSFLKQDVTVSNSITGQNVMATEVATEVATDTDSEFIDSTQDKLNKLIPEKYANAIPGFRMMGKRDILNYYNSMLTYSKAISQYLPSRNIQAKVDYFKASFSEVMDEEKWSLYSEKPITYHYMEGDHFFITSTTNIAKISEAINRRLPQLK